MRFAVFVQRARARRGFVSGARANENHRDARSTDRATHAKAREKGMAPKGKGSPKKDAAATSPAAAPASPLQIFPKATDQLNVQMRLSMLDQVQNIQATNKDGSTALMEAAAGGLLPVVKSLLGQGANAETADNDGFTALMFAAAAGHLEVVRALMQKGADINKVDKYGMDAKTLATNAGHLAVAELIATPMRIR
jgi:ankyrin repeat protein